MQLPCRFCLWVSSERWSKPSCFVVIPTDYDTILSIDKNMSERSSKVHSAHVDGCNKSVSSAVLPGARPKAKTSREGVAAAPRIKRRHSLQSAGRPTLRQRDRDPEVGTRSGSSAINRLARSARALASFASYADPLLSQTEIVSWGPESHGDLGKAETS
jgi:hypothetical protein